MNLNNVKLAIPELGDISDADLSKRIFDSIMGSSVTEEIKPFAEQAQREAEFGVIRAGEPTDIQRPLVDVIKEQVAQQVKRSLISTADALYQIGKDPRTMTPEEQDETLSIALGFTPFGFARKLKLTGSALKVEEMYNRATKEALKVKKTDIIKTLRRTLIDVSGNVKKRLLRQGELGKKAVMHKDLISGASSKANQNFHDASFKIYKGLNSSEHEYLDRLIQSRRTITIEKYKQIKHPEGLGAVEHQEFLDQLPVKLRIKLDAKADEYFGEMRKILDNLKKEGLVTDESYKALVESGDYSPRNFLKYADPEITRVVGGRKISVAESGIKALKEGDYSLLEKDSSLLLANAMTRSQTRIFRNRANQALHALAEQVPDNGIVKIGQKAGPLEEKISVLIDGQKKEMIMPTDMAREWVKNDPAINQSLATTLGWLSGSKILRPMATGLNPEFALTNFPRDMAHIWITTEQYSPTLPKFMFQMGNDLRAVKADAFLRKGRYLDYINEGGGMDFLTHQGRFKPKGHATIERVQDAMGYFGETSEIWTRLALRERALKNGLSPTEATWIARDYLDFNQGGSFTKALDSAVPYLNAGTQGTRGLFKAGAKNPKIFAYKTAQIGTLATSLYLANSNLNREAWESIHPREKVNNWIITTPFSYKDKNGDERYIYFKIAKDQGQRVFATMFESLMAKYMGEEVDVDQIIQSIEDAIPIMPETVIPPSLDAMLGYSMNKDFWRNQDIWRGPQVLPREEWSLYTHPAFIKFGDITGMSPERTRYALSQYFTSGNIYTSMAGYGWKQIFDEMPEAEKHKVTEELILNKPFIRRMVNETSSFNKQRKEVEEIKIQSNTERYIVNREFDILTNNYLDGMATRKDVNDFINSQERKDRKRLKTRLKKSERLKDVPDRTWWLKASSLNPEARATVYWNRWKNADDEEKKMLRTNLRKVPSFSTKRFRRQFNILKQKGAK